MKPYTHDTECSVALSLNPHVPVESELLVSHAWSESILEVQEAVNDRAKTSLPGVHMLSAGKTRRSVNPAALGIWIRLFALYDFNEMPSVTLNSPFVCLVVGSKADVCKRAWCAQELDIILNMMNQTANSSTHDDSICVEFSQLAYDNVNVRHISSSEAEKEVLLSFFVQKIRAPFD